VAQVIFAQVSFMDLFEEDDLALLRSLNATEVDEERATEAQVSVATPRPIKARVQEDTPAWHQDPALTNELSGLEQLVAFSEKPLRPGRTRYEAALVAQNAKLVRSKRSLEETSSDMSAASAEFIRRLASDFPVVRRCYGIRAPATSNATIEGAEIRMALAVAPKVRGTMVHRAAQARAACVITHTGVAVQRECASSMLGCCAMGGSSCSSAPPPAQSSGSAPVPAGGHVTKGVVLCWDEAAQRVQRFRCSTDTIKVAQGASTCQVIVAVGNVANYYQAHGHKSIHRKVEPLLFRARRLQAGTAPFIYEALRRALPFDIRDLAPLIHDVGPDSSLEVFWFFLGPDRATVNYNTGQWVFADLLLCPKALPHIEFCKGHGVMLARNRAQAAKKLRTGLGSMTKWMKLATNQDVLVKGIRDAVDESDFEWVRAVRPDEEIMAAEDLKRNLFLNTDTLTKPIKQPDGSTRLVKSRFHEQLDRVLACARLTGPRRGKLCHWCKLLPEGSTMVRAALEWCCNSDSEARGKVADELVSWDTGEVWCEAADNRWTTQPQVQKKALVSQICGDHLSRGLQKARAGHGLDKRSVVEALSKLLAADSDNFSAKNKLRLNSICNIFIGCDGGVAATRRQLANLVVIGAFPDHILFSMFGKKGVRPRYDLGEMLHPDISPVLQAQEGLLVLLQNFTSCRAWAIGEAAGMDFTDERTRGEARSHALLTSAGIFTFLERGWGLEPYRVSCAAFKDALPEDSLRLVVEFFGQCKACMPIAAQRLREIYGTPAALLRAIKMVFDMFHKLCPIINDHCERLNSRVRSEVLRGSGKGCNFTTASNRNFAHTMMTEHLEQKGIDPNSREGARASGMEEVVRRLLGNHGARAGQGGSVFQTFHNVRMAVLSELERNRLRAPGLEGDKTVDTGALEVRIAEEWDAIRIDPTLYGEWRDMFRAKRMKAAQQDTTEGAEVPTEPFSGLWGSSAVPHHVLDPSAVANAGQALRSLGKQAHDNLISRDDNLEVRAPVPDRGSMASGVSLAELQGCAALHRNICLKHCLSRVQGRRMTQLTSRLTSFVDSLGKEQAQSANTIFVHVGEGGEDEPNLYQWWLLVDARYNPKVQVCSPIEVPATSRKRYSPLVSPIKAEVAVGKPNMEVLHYNKLSVQFRTSDEVAWSAVEAPLREWTLRRVLFEWAEGPNLLYLWIKGVEDIFVAKPVEKKLVDDDIGLIMARDPWEVGPTETDGRPMRDGSGLPGAGDPDSDSVFDGVRGDPVAESDLEVDLVGCSGEREPVCHPDPLDVPVVELLSGVPPEAEPRLDADALVHPKPEDPTPPEKPPSPPTPPERPTETQEPRRRPEVVMHPRGNQVILRGRMFTRLRREGVFSGYSLKCPSCNLAKNLDFVKSGMLEEVALDRLERWADSCRPNHRDFGGHLLKDYAD